MIGLACIGSVMSPSVVVVVPLKPEMTRPTEFNISEESLIWLKEVATISLQCCQDLLAPYVHQDR